MCGCGRAHAHRTRRGRPQRAPRLLILLLLLFICQVTRARVRSKLRCGDAAQPERNTLIIIVWRRHARGVRQRWRRISAGIMRLIIIGRCAATQHTRVYHHLYAIGMINGSGESKFSSRRVSLLLNTRAMLTCHRNRLYYDAYAQQ